MLFAHSGKCFHFYSTKNHAQMNMFQAINNALMIVLEKDEKAGKCHVYVAA